MLDYCVILLLPLINFQPDYTKSIDEVYLPEKMTFQECKSISEETILDFDDESLSVVWSFGWEHP